MALTKPKRATAPAKAVEAEEDVGGITSVTVARGFKIGGSDYSSASVFVSVAAPTYEQADEAVTEYLQAEIEKVSAHAGELGIVLGGDSAGIETGIEGEAETGSEGEAEGGVGAEDIMAMSRDEIVALITDNELSTDPDEFPKTKPGLNKLREAVVAEAFSDDAGEAEEAGEGEAAEGEDGEAISEDTINAMDRPKLVAFIKEYELDIDPKKYTKLSELKAVVIETLSDGSEGGEGEDTGEGYSEDDLKALGIDDLKALWAEWEIPGKFPTGPAPVAKKNAITKILAFQSEAAE